MSNPEQKNWRLGIIGNPNVGKSSVFNLLSRDKAKVGNYPGITIEKKTGLLKTRDQKVEIIDLPGIYSLRAHSPEMKVALDTLLAPEEEGGVGGFVVVMDGANLRRNLHLLLEVKSLGKPVMGVVTMLDQFPVGAARPDLQGLSKDIGIPLVQVDGRSARSGKYLRGELSRFLEQRRDWSPPPEADLEPLKKFDSRQIRIRELYVHNLAGLSHGATRKIDQYLLRPWIGLSFFFVVFLVMFQALFTWASPLMDFIGETFAGLKEVTAASLGEGIVVEMLTDGVIEGVANVLVFLPQIAILFLFIGILEDSGFLARAAFILNRLFSRIGLSGKSLVPLLSSNACAVPGIMAARTLPTRGERLTVIMIAPLMTCSARLPVYTFLISAFVPAIPIFGFFELQGLTLAAFYFLGAFVAILAGVIIKTFFFKDQTNSFIIELPPYRLPNPRTLLREVGLKAGAFIQTAGTVILFLSIIIWFLSSFPRTEKQVLVDQTPGTDIEMPQTTQTENFRLENSYLGRMGKVMEPVLEPLGFNWKIGVIILTSFVAREVAVSTAGILYNCPECADDEDSGYKGLRERLKKDREPATGERVWTPLVGVTLMIFYAFAFQCMSTLAIARQETNSWKWPIIMFTYMSLLAYVSSLVFYQAGRSLGF